MEVGVADWQILHLDDAARGLKRLADIDLEDSNLFVALGAVADAAVDAAALPEEAIDDDLTRDPVVSRFR